MYILPSGLGIDTFLRKKQRLNNRKFDLEILEIVKVSFTQHVHTGPVSPMQRSQVSIFLWELFLSQEEGPD